MREYAEFDQVCMVSMNMNSFLFAALEDQKGLMEKKDKEVRESK